MPRDSSGQNRERACTSRAYRITVDGGRDSFYALSIEQEGREEAWLMADTVCSLASMR